MSSSVVVPPGKDGAPDMSGAVGVAPMKGGMQLSPALVGGRSRRTRRISKKVLKMLKKMSKVKLAKLMKGGQVEGEEGADGMGASPSGGKSRKGSRKGTRKATRSSRRSGLLY